MENKLCIYHGNCADGFTSAYIVNKHFDGKVDFYPGVYGEQPPLIVNRDVIIVDFSYKRETMTGIIKIAKSVLILDHHVSAQKDLEGLEGAEIVFDMNRSGASIVWDYFNPGKPRPAIIDHVEDRDLWNFKLKGTREVQANMFSYEYTFENWDMLMSADVEKVMVEGAAIDRKHFKDIRELINVCGKRAVIGGVDVPVVNLPYTMGSDACHIMSENDPFAAYYFDIKAARVFGLRSRKEGGADVSAIALQYGGGGHKNAAGFRVPLTHMLARI